MISIIIPTFNAPLRLNRAINSVLNQTSPKWEIIVCPDDGNNYSHLLSVDERIQIASSTLIATGPGVARNRGLPYAKGGGIAYLDDDDELSPNYVEASLIALETRAAVLFPTTYIDEDGYIIRTIGGDEQYSNIQRFALNLGSLHIVARANIFPKWRDGFAEDVIHTCEVIDKLGGNIKIIQSAKYIATVRSGSICTLSSKIDASYQKLINSNIGSMSLDGQKNLGSLFKLRRLINALYESYGNDEDYNEFVEKIDMQTRKKLLEEVAF